MIPPHLLNDLKSPEMNVKMTTIYQFLPDEQQSPADNIIIHSQDVGLSVYRNLSPTYIPGKVPNILKNSIF